MEQDFASCWTARARWRRWRNRLRARLRRLALWASLARAIRHMNTTIYDICQVGQGDHQRYLTERSNSKLSFVYVELPRHLAVCRGFAQLWFHLPAPSALSAIFRCTAAPIYTLRVFEWLVARACGQCCRTGL